MASNFLRVSLDKVDTIYAEGEATCFDGCIVRLITPTVDSPTALIKSLCWPEPSLLHHQLALSDLVHLEDFGYKVRWALIRKGILD